MKRPVVRFYLNASVYILFIISASCYSVVTLINIIMSSISYIMLLPEETYIARHLLYGFGV